MTLGELIKFLENQDPNLIVPMGFHNPHSYRGYYHDLAFEPLKNISVGEMLACAKSAIGKTFIGWKGGEFVMDEDTNIWLAEEGRCGESIGEVLLNYVVGNYKTDAQS